MYSRVRSKRFPGALEEALAAYLHARKDVVSDDERERLIALIEEAEWDVEMNLILITVAVVLSWSSPC